MINKGTEQRIALLAKNQDTTKLKLGYFLLKNPSPEQLKEGISLDERKRKELEFFSSALWKGHQLDPSRLGVNALRDFLQGLLDRHIERELPKVRDEIRALLLSKEAELARLGEDRSTVAHMRMFLTRCSMEYYNLAQAALEGNYMERDTNFFNGQQGDSTRLRAEVHSMNGLFADLMRERGSKRIIVPEGQEDESGPSPETVTKHGQILVTKNQFDGWVKKVCVLAATVDNWALILADIYQYTWQRASWEL